MTTPTQIEPPWSAEQVEQLNRFQQLGVMHPFTCGTTNKHTTDVAVVLVATADGWRCPVCDYTQNWAHAFMADRQILDSMEEGMG